MALDARPPSSPGVRIVKFDLTDLDALASLQQMVHHDADRIAMLWARVPSVNSGTTARVRDSLMVCPTYNMWRSGSLKRRTLSLKRCADCSLRLLESACDVFLRIQLTRCFGQLPGFAPWRA